MEMKKYVLTSFAFIVLNLAGNLIQGKPIDPKDPDFDGGQIVSYVDDSRVTEASGLASSKLHPGIVYTINDSGGTNQVFAIDTSDGSVRSVITIDGATNCDWEDIAVGIGPTGSWQIFVGDVGGNAGRVCDTIYIIEEPTVLEDVEVSPVKTIRFTWDEDDCETIFVDPNGLLYIVSKVNPGSIPRLYLVPQNWPYPDGKNKSDDRIPLVGGTEIWLRTDDPGPIAGDISPNGREVLLKTYGAILYYDIAEDESLFSGLQKQPSYIPYTPEPQGESIAWDPIGQGFYTLSEGLYEPIWYHDRTTAKQD